MMRNPTNNHWNSKSIRKINGSNFGQHIKTVRFRTVSQIRLKIVTCCCEFPFQNVKFEKVAKNDGNKRPKNDGKKFVLLVATFFMLHKTQDQLHAA